MFGCVCSAVQPEGWQLLLPDVFVHVFSAKFRFGDSRLTSSVLFGESAWPWATGIHFFESLFLSQDDASQTITNKDS